jgi:hypothetical protein
MQTIGLSFKMGGSVFQNGTSLVALEHYDGTRTKNDYEKE